MAGDRGPFVCQSQSLNIHIAAPNVGNLTSMHFYAWKKGLKTGLYYLRAQPKANAIQFTVDQKALAAKRAKDAEGAKGGLQKPVAKRAAAVPPRVPTKTLKPHVIEREECLNCGS